MKKILSIAPVVVIVMIVQNLTGQQRTTSANDDMWTGGIVYRQMTYDTIYGTYACGWQADTSWGEWRMEANIINSKGTGKSTSTGGRHGTSENTCDKTTGAIRVTMNARGQAPTQLDLSIDDELKEYGFTVDIPTCTGKKISNIYLNGNLEEKIVDDFSEGESQILVERYKLGKDRNILTGRIEKNDYPQKGVRHVLIWEWNLKRRSKP